MLSASLSHAAQIFHFSRSSFFPFFVKGSEMRIDFKIIRVNVFEIIHLIYYKHLIHSWLFNVLNCKRKSVKWYK